MPAAISTGYAAVRRVGKSRRRMLGTRSSSIARPSGNSCLKADTSDLPITARGASWAKGSRYPIAADQPAGGSCSPPVHAGIRPSALAPAIAPAGVSAETATEPTAGSVAEAATAPAAGDDADPVCASACADGTRRPPAAAATKPLRETGMRSQRASSRAFADAYSAASSSTIPAAD